MDTDVLFEISGTAEKTLMLLKADERERIRYVISGKKPGSVEKKGFVLLLPTVFREKDEEGLMDLLSAIRPEAVLVRNMEEIGFLKSISYRGKLMSDHHLYTFNRESRNVLKDLGISEDTVPLELNLHEIRDRGAEGSEIILYGRVGLMTTSQCVFKNTTGRCNKTPGGFVTGMTDRKRKRFPVFADCDRCLNTVFNSVPLSLFKELSEIEALNPSAVRVDITVEGPEEAAGIIRAALNRDRGFLSGPDHTGGHFRKGVE